MRKRTLAREYALTIFYQKDITRFDIQVVVDNFWKNEEKADSEVKKFTERLVFGVNQNLDVIDEKISAYATNWQLKRMAIIDRNILRLGLFELLFAEDIPPKVTINEAVELAKKFGDVESSKFVNGILDKIHKTEVDVG
ncbi:MAG TPA: transcription antitermination factor NusB [Candidatus Bathyarchaeia archaeon]|nr:transcription antitermination factor NusB [Candidatus Bathyarchaeia archaeon]